MKDKYLHILNNHQNVLATQTQAFVPFSVMHGPVLSYRPELQDTAQSILQIAELLEITSRLTFSQTLAAAYCVFVSKCNRVKCLFVMSGKRFHPLNGLLHGTQRIELLLEYHLYVFT